jgi:uncharacterized protein YidB (DUF937 family)
MGLLDVLRGMSNGPRGQAAPQQQGGGGMSPLTMGLLALLAYKAFKGGGPLGGLFGQQAQPPGAPAGSGYGTPPAGSGYSGPGYGGPGGSGYGGPPASGGGLADWLRGGLGGALAGGAAGSIVSGGISELLKRLQQNGHGDAGRSWIASGPNDPISPHALEQAAGTDTLDALAQETGMPREQLLQSLSSELPDTVNALTPDGRIPTEDEVSRWG